MGKQYLESQLVVALGGRLAEEIIYGENMVTTGASNDIQQVANIAKRMVKEWGMSEKVGCVSVQEQRGGGYMAMMQGRNSAWGDDINNDISEEVERLVNNSYLMAKKILTENADMLEELKEMLMDTEVVSAEEFQMLLVKYGAQTVKYELIGTERNREKLPFQQLPAYI